MVSNLIPTEINIDMSQMQYNDEEDMGKTAHHNITVELKEIACSPIPTNICSHGIEHFRKLTEKKNEELEDIVEKLEASRGYDSERIKKRLEKIGQHHGYNKSQMTKMLEKLNEADLYAILHYATTFNNVPFCKIIIEDYGCYVNLVGWDGETPLHIAARLTDINKPDQTADSSILLYLLSQKKININIQDSEGRTPLHLAIMYNCYHNTQYLISAGVKRDVGDIQKATPLHYACRFHQNTDTIGLFLDEPELFECKTGNNKRPIDTAAEYGNLDILQHLFETQQIKQPDATKGTAELINAAVCHQENTALSFLKRQQDHVRHHLNTLHLACRQLHGHKMVSHLINRASIMYQDRQTGCSPLMVAVQHKQIKCVQELLSDKACTKEAIELVSSVTLRTVFHICAEVNKKEITTELCQSRYLSILLVLAADISGDTPLHICAKVGNAHMSQILLDYIKNISSPVETISNTTQYRSMTNLDTNGQVPSKPSASKTTTTNKQMSTNKHVYKILNKKNKDKHTPLHVAIYNENLNVIHEILEYSDPSVINACDDQKRTSLHMAAEKGHVDIIKELIQHQANVNACDINDCTPLHDAARSSIHQNDNKERAECIESLVNEGEADINAINIRRETPLHIASEYGSKKLIKRLRKLGADLFATNVQGYNCLEVAIEQNNEEVVRYFIDDESGFDLMRNAQTHEKKSSWRSKLFGIQCEVDTPMRKLIREMPKMALLMLNKCSIMVGDSGTNVHKIIFVYEFLEDQYTINDWEEDNFGVQKKSEELMSALYTTNKVDLKIWSCSTLLHTARMFFEMMSLKFHAYKLTNAVPILDPICFGLFFLFIVLICIRWETLHDVESFELSYEQLREKYSNPFEHFPDKINHLLNALN
ncbi:unnamed protein product [Adineta steineri]|uniref:Uncharacterized protein n=1 Tax=Adineta steineri TaxID=433720 RepID=A0A814LYL3_9BILA|nr:unnamed protein product [Adineta steineri]CAF1071404.1 unnamed protein product [Adineta steineri]